MVVLIRSMVLVNHLHLALKSRELYLKLGGILPPEDKSHLEGTLMLGGILPPEDKFHSEGTLMLGGILPQEEKFHSRGTLMLGGNLKLESTINHKDKMCLLHPIHGAME